MSEPVSGIELDALGWLYGGDRDVDVACHSLCWVITRYSQKCVSVLHKGPMKQPAGTKMVLERARIDGQFGSCYTCCRCVKAAIEDLRSH
jgi:hypothetical protein